MDYKVYTKLIINLKNADLALRDKLIQSGKLEQGYDKEMEQLHNSNAQALDKIIEAIGYPTTDKVGEEASKAAWLVIQHAISHPNFMKKCLTLLKQEVSLGKDDPINLAYLTDRIAVFEGKPQLYGTQFDWDENGQLSPKPYDDIIKVNQRRRSLGLNTVEEQTEVIRKRTSEENQSHQKILKKGKAILTNGERRLVG